MSTHNKGFYEEISTNIYHQIRILYLLLFTMCTHLSKDFSVFTFFHHSYHSFTSPSETFCKHTDIG